MKHCDTLVSSSQMVKTRPLPSYMRGQHYSIEPTSADSPSQNGAVKIYNNKLGVRVRTLLYGSELPAAYWSLALQHSVYLQNRLVHSVTKQTPAERFLDSAQISDISRLSGRASP